jgi:type I restriction enzyme S subunit
VEWLGNVPEYWEVRSFPRCAAERADYRGATPAKTDSGIFLVTAKNIRKGWIDYEASREFVSDSDYPKIMRRGLPRAGDLLLTTEAPLGNAALVDREDVALAQRVIRFRMNSKLLDAKFALHAVLSPYFQRQLLQRGTGSTALGIKASKLPQLQIVCPPIAEQVAILEFIEGECAPANVAAATARSEIDLLREYRTRLIADVVTGKLDVREAAARLPQEAEDLEPLDEAEVEGAAEETDAGDGVGVPEEVET